MSNTPDSSLIMKSISIAIIALAICLASALMTDGFKPNQEGQIKVILSNPGPLRSRTELDSLRELIRFLAVDGRQPLTMDVVARWLQGQAGGLDPHDPIEKRDDSGKPPRWG